MIFWTLLDHLDQCAMVEITAFRLESKSREGFYLQINFPPMRALQFITDHVIFKFRYNQIYQMKTTMMARLRCTNE